MKSPLFSTYRQGENRVTSSMLAVFQRIDLALVEDLLGRASGESSLSMVTFTNQPAGGGPGVPDARIQARFSYWFEVKTSPDALTRVQLDKHLHKVGPAEEGERLFVITPDAVRPALVEEIADPRVTWFSFADLHQAIENVLADERAASGEQVRFLLRELQELLVQDGLIDTHDTVVVAASGAYPLYLNHTAAYVCQPGRTFRPGLTHLGFYAHGRIQPYLPRILAWFDQVPITREEAERRSGGTDSEQQLAQVIRVCLELSEPPAGSIHKVALLSEPDAPDTVKRQQPILNDLTAASGRRWAWTMSQRYTRLSRLVDEKVTTTGQLAAASP